LKKRRKKRRDFLLSLYSPNVRLKDNPCKLEGLKERIGEKGEIKKVGGEEESERRRRKYFCNGQFEKINKQTNKQTNKEDKTR